MEHIWIIDPYSELPQAGWRVSRYFLIAKFLSKAGYNVHVFISNFSHKEKTFEKNIKQISLRPNLKIILVETPGYKKHISFERIKYEQTFAKNVAANPYGIELPSIIILKDPAIFMFGALKSFIELSKAKLIIDIIDLWPEMFEFKLPKHLRCLGKLIFLPFYHIRRKIFLSACAVTAVAPDYLTQVLKYNTTIPGKVIYWGCNSTLIKRELKSANKNLLAELKIPAKENNIWGIYAGTLGQGYDIETLLKAAKSMQQIAPQLKFIIAGTGPMQEVVEIAANKSSNIYFVGSLPTRILYQLFSFCDFGFSTYVDGSAVSMPIKCYDYFAAGLPLVNSLHRNLENLITAKKLGFQYKASDVKSLIEALTLLLKSDLQEMRARCKNISCQFDNKVQYPQIVEIVKSMAG